MSLIEWFKSRFGPDKYALALLEAHNKRRAKRGIPLLKMDARLNRAARAHARDMAANNYFDHTGLDGSDAGQRMVRQGYYPNLWGENIAWGQESVSEVMHSWMESDRGHREMILNSDAEDVGFGAASYSNGRPVWVAVFGREP